MDAINLRTIILTLPIKGTLVLVGSGPITTTGGIYNSSSSFYIAGKPLQYGLDSFSYQVNCCAQ